MAENKNIDKSESLIFIKDCLPQMAAGEYTVGSNFVLDSISSNEIEQSSKTFYVNGPRFSLLPSDIYNIYPPNGLTGLLDTTLPHIVFKRRTLPWERTIDGAGYGPPETGHASWMALILLDEDEMEAYDVKIENRNISELLIPSREDEASVMGPDINMSKLSPWEKEGNSPADIKCDTIDIGSDLFKIIAPKLEDLPYLAHVRKVEVDENKEQADNEDDGYFSVIIGNRLPTKKTNEEVRHSVFLVSLEGFSDYIKTTNPSPLTSTFVRLNVLKNWNFTVAAGKNFKELCEDLAPSPLRNEHAISQSSNATLKGAYEYGYTALRHLPRTGGKTLSWFRGPLNPNFIPTEPQTKTFDCADQALRYDNKSGQLDVSYAAAWQLGRLMALKDQEFSNSLYKWKILFKQKLRKAKIEQQIKSLLPGYVSSSEDMLLEDMVKDFLLDNYTPSSGADESPADYTVSTEYSETDWAAQNDEAPPVPTLVSDWLGKLYLLHGVPFNYLVPHEQLLKTETVGTFYVDSTWVEALLDGALSIARNSESEILMNQVRNGAFLPPEIQENKKEVQDFEKEINPDDDAEEGDAVPEMADEITGHVTGFLLRSQLISGWKGIKVLAKDKGSNWLLPLRLERIESDIMLCIFSGKVTEIIIIQPPEGLHFELEYNNNSWVKKIRSSDGTVTTAEKPFTLRNTEKKVLNIKTFADDSSSADFAFQMINSPIIYTLTIND